MSEPTVRPFEGGDLPAILSIWNRALRRDPITEARFVRSILADPDFVPGRDSGFFVAVLAGRPAGFLRAIVRRVPNDRVGLEPEEGYIPAMGVDPDAHGRGIGGALMRAAIDFFAKHGRKRVWVCGNTGSAPGYIFPGVDRDAYPAALALFGQHGFVVDHEPVAMLGEIVDFDVEGHRKKAWEVGQDVVVETLTPAAIADFFAFLASAFPGDWNTAARAHIKAGRLGDMLIARDGGAIVGFCQWDGEHFGPFGVGETARNKRIGAKLFVEAVRRIRENDGRTVWFNWADPDAARFYERYGLHPTRRFAILRKDME